MTRSRTNTSAVTDPVTYVVQDDEPLSVGVGPTDTDEDEDEAADEVAVDPDRDSA